MPREIVLDARRRSCRPPHRAPRPAGFRRPIVEPTTGSRPASRSQGRPPSVSSVSSTRPTSRTWPTRAGTSAPSTPPHPDRSTGTSFAATSSVLDVHARAALLEMRRGRSRARSRCCHRRRACRGEESATLGAGGARARVSPSRSRKRSPAIRRSPRSQSSGCRARPGVSGYTPS
jgi:hypothetical protein